jgi:sarcosine/dimethylglycine N-methyltransferase
VGGSLFYLLERLTAPALGVGCTLSPAQARLAVQRRAEVNLGSPCLFVEADFQHVPLPAGFDLVFSVEAFVHAAAPARYLAEASRLLRPGGRLILVDDFRAPAAPESDLAARRWLAAYQAGWHAPNLQRPAEVAALAAAYGLRLLSDRDLTPLIRLRALPEALAEVLLAAGRRLPVWHASVPSMLGSMALQQCLRAGWITYRALAFERAG